MSQYYETKWINERKDWIEKNIIYSYDLSQIDLLKKQLDKGRRFLERSISFEELYKKYPNIKMIDKSGRMITLIIDNRDL